jgi:methane monooxygenase PmoA-like
MVHHGASVELSCGGRVVARYVWDPQLPATVSPRPYLHPVTTLAGTTVTGFMPDDHRHHLGASVAIPVLNQANFWGGRTYVAGHGSVHLDNHGRQRHARWLDRSSGHLVQELCWYGHDDQPLAREQRSLTVSQVTETAWLLQVGFSLSSSTTSPLTIDSPGARGRTGAGYGGFFWRAPSGLDRVRAFGLEAGAEVHGSRQPWVALTGSGPGAAAWTLVFLAGAGVSDPWFVRAEDYAGVGAAVAWDRPLVVAAGGVLSRRLSVLVADGPPGEKTMAAAREVVL